MRQTKTTQTILFSILFLFFLQTLSDFIEAIYAFGLLVTAFTIQVASIVLLFTPLLFLLFRKPPSRSVLLGISYVALLARLLEPLLNPGGKLVACGISVGAFMLLFTALLQSRREVQGWQIGNGLAIAVCLSIFFRTANSSLDLSESGIFQLLSWLLALLAAGLLWRMEFIASPDASLNPSTAGKRITGLTIGLTSVILMIYFAFSSPTVIARWTGLSYSMIVSVLVIALFTFGVLLNSGVLSTWLTRRPLIGWNILFVLLLVLTILPDQILFPSNPDLYPLDAPAPSPLGIVFLLLMLVFSPVIFVDFMLFARQISLEKPTLPQLGGSFAIAALFFLVMVFFHVFTTVYDYVPVVGPWFRDRFWLVYLLAGLGLLLPTLLLRQETFPFERALVSQVFPPIALGMLAILSLVALLFTVPRPADKPSGYQLKIMTYNIQQGFDEEGNKNLDGQLAVIRSVNPDLLGLQESDTARVANGNVDAVRYFADHLDMYSYYGPTTTTGTFGIALLSKYPIESPKTLFLYSTEEQTAAIQAEISVEGKTYQIFVTHLGNGGPKIQLQNLLTRVDNLKNVIAMGDFNFRPPTDQYDLITSTLADAWLLKWPKGKETGDLLADERIDHIFVSPEMNIAEAEYIVNPASDHPSMYIVIQP
ncbi:MAG TPA: endonuclease/exonuclease/phosphatase family protein [Anaerolineales bacterium]|nr:endonuclease/exonuclease/phosphatase family protein [Anaerolineales bacterium]